MGLCFMRTKCEKSLIVSTILFVLLSIGLLVGVIVLRNKENSDDYGICETPVCLYAAAELQRSLNLDADPCDDFYEYACGGWMKDNTIPPERSRWSQFDVTRNKLAVDVRVSLDSETNKTYPTIVSLTKDLYKQCMNLTTRENNGLTELKALINSIEFPMINKGILNNANYNWTDVFAQLNRNFGFSYIMANYVYLDAKNTSIYSLYVDAPTFGVGRAQLVDPESVNNKKIIDAYKQFINDSVNLFANSDFDISPTIDADIKQLVDFEISLANITADSASRRDRQNLYGNKTNINDFINSYNDIQLDYIENKVFEGILSDGINSNEGLIVYDRNYFSRLGNILRNTDKVIIANYLSWRTIKSLGSFTTKEFRNIEFEYNKVVSGVEEPKPLWEDCVDIVNSNLGFAVGRLYVDNYFDEKGKQDMIEMIKQLNEAFKQLLTGNDWMQDITKKVTLNKLDKMLDAIAYPDFIVNDTQLSGYYDGLNFGSETYFSSIVSINDWSTRRSLKRVANNFTFNREDLDWNTGPAIVNAFFSSNINRITFPAGILQSPFYTLGLPVSLNLGAIGVVIGHEITHSFDDSGSQYDEYGNLFNWWDDITKVQFESKVQCIKDQYSSYNDSLAGIPINGNTTIGENIADNGGLRQAYQALENFGGTKLLLPASMKSFTSEQIFFLSFANVWCTNTRREALISQIETDPHSPGKYRVWGSVSNSEGFAKAFNCTTGDRMNPDLSDKCILW